MSRRDIGVAQWMEDELMRAPLATHPEIALTRIIGEAIRALRSGSKAEAKRSTPPSKYGPPRAEWLITPWSES